MINADFADVLEFMCNGNVAIHSGLLQVIPVLIELTLGLVQKVIRYEAHTVVRVRSLRE